ncbi:MAG TPA: hypothetical protein VEX37_00450 [Thermomicrobiales bacterium]|nr:hypothetical protein [Thermomicrobiales bacterium]
MAQSSEQSIRDWHATLMATLSDAIEHLQLLIFEEGWDALLAETGSHEAALRESVARYERELARLFGFLRSSGALPDAVAWSTLKVEYRRAALEAETEISLRTALESGFYAAESVPLGDHRRYLRWSAALRAFLASRAAATATKPGPGVSEDERLLWAYETLAELEEHDAFNAAFVTWLIAEPSGQDSTRDVIEFQERLLALPRFDLVLNTSLRWLAASASS